MKLERKVNLWLYFLLMSQISILLKSEQGRPFIIGGYASVNIKDREGHRITLEALRKALPRFMGHPEYRNVMLMHSDVQVGIVLPEWTDSQTGRIYKTEVDSNGLYCVAKLRDDIDIANKVKEEIEKGNILSFSIAGAASEKERAWENGQFVELIKDLDIFEVTLCCEGVNQLAKFEILQKRHDFDKKKRELLSEVEQYLTKAVIHELQKCVERMKAW